MSRKVSWTLKEIEHLDKDPPEELDHHQPDDPSNAQETRMYVQSRKRRRLNNLAKRLWSNTPVGSSVEVRDGRQSTNPTEPKRPRSLSPRTSGIGNDEIVNVEPGTSCSEFDRTHRVQFTDWGFDFEISTFTSAKNFQNKVIQDIFELKPIITGVRDIHHDDFREIVNKMVSTGIKKVLEKYQRKPTKIQVTLCNQNLYKHQSTKFRPLNDIDIIVKETVDKLANAKNSEDAKRGVDDVDEGNDIRLEDTRFHITAFFDESKFGGGFKVKNRYGTRVSSGYEWAARKRSMVDPLSKRLIDRGLDSQSCIPLAIILGKFNADNKNQPDFVKNFTELSKCAPKLKKNLAKLVETVGLAPKGPYSISDVDKIHKKLFGQNYQINCYFDATKPKFSFGPNQGKQINLFFDQGDDVGHCYLIKNILSFIGVHRKGPTEFCVYCKSPYSLKYNHRCEKSKCKLCKQIGCDNSSTEKLAQNRLDCEGCSYPSWTRKCLETHKQVNKEACGAQTRCDLCHVRYEKKRGHKCGLIKCTPCNQKLPFDHWCFMAKDKERTGNKVEMQRFYADIETMKMDDGQCIPNLLIVQRGDREEEPYIYHGTDCIKNFIFAARQDDSPFKDSYLCFHNMKGFDGILFLGALRNMGYKFDVISRGQEILSLEIKNCNIQLRDSLLYMPGTSLSQFSKMFKLDPNLDKGFFPHSLNTPEQLAKDAFEEDSHRFPPKYHFEPEKMSASRREAFLNWWAGEAARFHADPTARYNVKTELQRYCAMDVTVLKQGMEKYREEWAKNNEGQEVFESITLPSLANKNFRNNYMEEESIALLPPQGYGMDAKGTLHGGSTDELAWLAWMTKKLGLVELRHNRNSQPIQLGNIKVDGWGRDADGDHYVLQYHGCFWHGCDLAGCQSPRDEEAALKAASRRARTIEQRQRLKRLSEAPKSPYPHFTYIEIYEHDFKQQLKDNNKMADFVRSYKKSLFKESNGALRGLSLREAFMGGRTEVFQHHFTASANEKMAYYDFTSLYPSVNACSKPGEEYPTGHPNIYIGLDVDNLVGEVGGVKNMFGFVHCRLQPPTRLLIPVVPARINNKLIFTLCRTCAVEENQDKCRHAPAERALTVHLPTPEFRKALEVGYTVEQMFEAWHWPEHKRSAVLLRPFINKMYLSKEYASGFPEHASTEEEKKNYADQVSQTLGGIPVDWTKFDKNPALRAVSKFAVNNVWGFFGKRGDHSKTEMVDDPHKWDLLVADEEKEILNVLVHSNGAMMEVEWRPVEEPMDKKSAVALAAFTTSYARLRLVEKLHILGRDAAYCDTDSVFVIERTGAPKLHAPGTFGELKDEIKSDYPNEDEPHIFDWACFAPKSYSYKKKDRHGKLLGEDMKTKGVTLASRVRPHLNHAVVKELAKGGDPVRVPQQQFKKSYKDGSVHVLEMTKRVAAGDVGKRRLCPDKSTTLPYGYVDNVSLVFLKQNQ